MKPKQIPNESLADREARTKKIIQELKREYPGSKCSLNFTNPFELSVATILSAQCTDKRVNKVTKDLFKKYPTPEHYASADIKELEQDIRSTGFYRNKAKSIKGFATGVIDEYGGEVPQSMEKLTDLPGVGRKTANVILGVAHKIPGLVVDTHVKRISRLLGLTTETDPEKIEYDLQELVPKDDWTQWAHLIIDHGRAVCKARSPQCGECVLFEYCPSGVIEEE
ncbi:MAG: endonuclease III [Candidatus Marinimicrobia bacterium]|nr:endonuclease III [Candidatus Neomarinimicrobiota bacterium]MCF7828412.1 endonuclease III [Candidatus Neomarinimicrobiota bacterium]MCF7880994.1 endonuclease III [Candidatus Neomarinimicrobiota bacterium]